MTSLRCRYVVPFLLSFLATTRLPAPGDVGNGGDAVLCSASPENNFSGYYSLDFLLTYQASHQNDDVSDVNSMNDSMRRILQTLRVKVPELSENFAAFVADIRNTDDFSRPHIWEEASFGLIDLHDENIRSILPRNCRTDDGVQIVQAVLRLPSSASGLFDGKILYQFVPSVFSELERTSPLQLSFLLVHEWLWDYSGNVEKNRRINRFMHSDDFFSGSRERVRSQLEGLGLNIRSGGNLPPATIGGEIHQLKASSASACALKGKELICIGYHKNFPGYLGQLQNPTDFALGNSHVCVLDAGKIKCHAGNVSYLQNQPPPFLNGVRALASGAEFMCALHRQGVTCWGQNFDHYEFIPGTETAGAISAAVENACAILADGKSLCWEHRDLYIQQPYARAAEQVPNLKQIAVGLGHVLLRGSILGCYGENIDHQCEAPQLSNVKFIAAGADHSCAIDDDGLSCWGKGSAYAGMPFLQNPREVATGYGFTCALDDSGVSCWGRARQTGQLEVPESLRLN